jgi:SAM-dependent methyltransferase
MTGIASLWQQMKTKARALYEQMKEEHAKRIGLLAIPERYRSHLVCVGGASEQAWLIMQLCQRHQAKRILVVGVFGGRDFWFLRANGYDVDGFDIVQPSDFPPIYVGNVEEAHTLPRGPYDAVILAEVLEHLRDDATALRNLRGVLGPDGILILTVPFFDDRPEWHIRIYSPRSIKRLLEACGFRVVDMYFRPSPFPICLRKLINTIIHGINAASYIISGRTVYHRLLPILWALYMKFSRWQWPNSLSRAFGATVVAVRSNSETDLIELNRKAFWRGEDA